MKIEKIPPYKGDVVNVIIETPRLSQNKFNYDPELKTFLLKKTLPVGMVFPFDFGFVPNTTGGDGDPLDILVIMDEPVYPGCLVKCRLLGVLEAVQTEKNGETEKNDRIVAVPTCSVMYEGIRHISELSENMQRQIESFFVNYNKQEGKKFSPGDWKGADAAFKLIKKCCDDG